MKEAFFRNRAWQVKALVGLIVFSLFGIFCIIQFVRFDSSKRNPRYTTEISSLSVAEAEDYELEELNDLKLPGFAICPTYARGVKANITGVQCNIVLGGQASSPLPSQKVALPLFTPRHKGVILEDCYVVTNEELLVVSENYYADYMDCVVSTKENAMIHLFTDSWQTSSLPEENSKWTVLKKGVDSNIIITKLKTISTSKAVTEREWEVDVQEQDDIIIDEEKAVVFTVQFGFLGSINERGFFPYDFWIMIGTIGGTYIIFHALFAAVIFCAFQFLNIKGPEDYETINDK